MDGGPHKKPGTVNNMPELLNTALMRPTYETDFYAIDQLLERSGIITPGPGLLSLACDGRNGYTLTEPSGVRHSHLIKEYAIHHLLYYFYRAA